MGTIYYQPKSSQYGRKNDGQGKRSVKLIKLEAFVNLKITFYHVNYPYTASYLHMCVGQMGGGHDRITAEYAGHIIHQSTWHTVFKGERWEIGQT